LLASHEELIRAVPLTQGLRLKRMRRYSTALHWMRCRECDARGTRWCRWGGLTL